MRLLLGLLIGLCSTGALCAASQAVGTAAVAPSAALVHVPADDGIVRSFSDLGGKPYTVTYNARSMKVSNRK